MIYKITIKDTFFKQELTGEFNGETEYDAKKEAKEFYALELDTNPENIIVLSTKKI